MFEANIHLRPLHTSILGIFKVFEPLVCCLKGIWVHPYTVTPAKPTPDLGTHGHLKSGNDVITSWLRLISTSDHFMHPYYAYTMCLSYWYAVSRAFWCTLIPLHRPSCPRFGDSGSLEEWKWCHNVMFWADIYLRPLHTYILDIYKVFESLVCCLKGMWVHPYTITPVKLAPIFGFRFTCGVKMMP